MRPALVAGAKRPTQLSQLLAEPGSLTAALQRSGRVTVAVLSQAMSQPHADERPVLNARAQRRHLVREVVLRVDGTPCVFAHTVANGAAQRLLARAGGRPLATVLFADPQVKLMSLYYRRLDERHPLFAKASSVLASPKVSRSQKAFDARRALFVRGRARLLITEVFLMA
jgi:chorismate--pyruvate lyase